AGVAQTPVVIVGGQVDEIGITGKVSVHSIVTCLGDGIAGDQGVIWVELNIGENAAGKQQNSVKVSHRGSSEAPEPVKVKTGEMRNEKRG
ncbi:MAG: hypothetical protein Q9203_006906, partial [Teloschistes exilis]